MYGLCTILYGLLRFCIDFKRLRMVCVLCSCGVCTISYGCCTCLCIVFVCLLCVYGVRTIVYCCVRCEWLLYACVGCLNVFGIVCV